MSAQFFVPSVDYLELPINTVAKSRDFHAGLVKVVDRIGNMVEVVRLDNGLWLGHVPANCVIPLSDKKRIVSQITRLTEYLNGKKKTAI